MKRFYLFGLASILLICPSVIAQTTYINFTITQDPLLVSDAGTGSTLCNGDFANLNGNASGGDGAYTYQWLPSADVVSPTNQNTTANPNFTTTYTLTVTDGNNCTSADNMVVTLPPQPFVVNAGGTTTICMGSNTSLFANTTGGYGGNTIQWSPGGIFSDSTILNPTATPTVTTTCYVTITDSLLCTVTDSITITVIDCSGIEDEFSGNMQIYPNPSNGIFTISLDALTGNDDYDVKIFTATGSVVYQKPHLANGTFQVDLRPLAGGIYTIMLYHSGVPAFSQKIFIQ